MSYQTERDCGLKCVKFYQLHNVSQTTRIYLRTFVGMSPIQMSAISNLMTFYQQIRHHQKDLGKATGVATVVEKFLVDVNLLWRYFLVAPRTSRRVLSFVQIAQNVCAIQLHAPSNWSITVLEFPLKWDNIYERSALGTRAFYRWLGVYLIRTLGVIWARVEWDQFCARTVFQVKILFSIRRFWPDYGTIYEFVTCQRLFGE